MPPTPSSPTHFRLWRLINAALLLLAFLAPGVPAGSLAIGLGKAARPLWLYYQDDLLRLPFHIRLLGLGGAALLLLLMISPVIYSAASLRAACTGALPRRRAWLAIPLLGALLWTVGAALFGGLLWSVDRSRALFTWPAWLHWAGMLSSLALEASERRGKAPIRFHFSSRGQQIFASGLIVLALAAAPLVKSASSLLSPPIALVNGRLIDGTGAAPLEGAVVIVRAGRISAVGVGGAVAIPARATVIDVGGGTILPGFINAHVHNAFSGRNLEAWAWEGVTTVRDEGIIQLTVSPLILLLRDYAWQAPQYARLVSAGAMLSVPGGYGQAFVSSPEEAGRKAAAFLDSGAEALKLSMEDGYAGRHNLPKLSAEELAAIVAAAHARGKPVSAHVTQAAYLEPVLDAGVDDVAHMVWDGFSDAQIRRLIAEEVYFVPTLTVLEAYGALGGSLANLRRFVAAGGKVALGNDYTDIPQNHFDHFDLGMPVHEIGRMAQAGMTPMQIVVAATQNAAHVCNLDGEIGTLETGKAADILVVRGDPLQDLQALADVRLVIHNGLVIRDERP
jgi:imidazolonepropionase-like amidohydrolase